MTKQIAGRRTSARPLGATLFALVATSPLVLTSVGCQGGPPEGLASGQQELAGDWNDEKLALDAPWRMEPSPTGTYGMIPIHMTLMDNARAGSYFEYLEFVEITERYAGESVTTRITPNHFHELEAYEGLWAYDSAERHDSSPCRPAPLPGVDASAPDIWASACPTVPERGRICRGWLGTIDTVCPDLDVARLERTDAWHGTIMYPIRWPALPGRYVELHVEAKFKTGNASFAKSDDLMVHLAPAPLPKFGPGWAYGDLHYHSEVTNNFGEQGYSFRGTLSAMSAIGLDFAFSTDHTSNNERFFGADAAGASTAGLSDASPTKWAYSHWLLNYNGPGGKGANHEVLSVPRQRAFGLAAPQLFLGGEFDVIPETENRNLLGFRGTQQPIENLCQPDTFGCGDFWWLDPLALREILGISEFDAKHLAEPIPGEPGHYFVHDPQGLPLTTEYYGRQHLVHLPRNAARDDSGIMADNSVYGGATRRLRDLIRDELEAKQKGYAFLAHPFYSPGPDDPGFLDEHGRRGPDIVGFSESQLNDAFRSQYILGAQFWNENNRFESDGSGSPFTGGTSAEPWFEHGTDYPKWNRTMRTYLASWDELLMWGIDPVRTVEVDWLGPNEPRRFFMAGGSDGHGDFNYRREGRISGTNGINDTAIGNPRNLVFAGEPEGSLTQLGRTAARFTQEQVVDGLRSGNFSVTDGPAVRIVYDRNRNGVIDAGDSGMGSVTPAEFTGPIPVLVEWKSTEEFGQVGTVSLVIGMHGNGIGTKYRGAHATSLTVPPVVVGNRQFRGEEVPGLGTYRSDFNDFNFLRFKPTLASASDDYTGDAYGGTYRFWISPEELPLIIDGQQTPAGVAERMWIRVELSNDWTPGSSVRGTHRHAYSNPLWLTKAPPPGPEIGDVAIDPDPVPTDDIVWQTASGQMRYWRMQGGQKMVQLDVSDPVHPAWVPKAVGDLNGDGTDDIVFRQNNGQVHFWPMGDGQRLGGINIGPPISSVWTIRGAGDVDGDGTDDIIWQHQNGQVHCWIMRGGGLVSYHDIGAPVGSDWLLVGAGDVNGDGTDDIVFQHVSGQMHYWPMRDRQRVAGYHISVPVEAGWLVREVGDVTGDGTDDIVFQRSTGELHYWRMQNGAKMADVDIAGPVGSTWKLIGVGDLD